IATGSKPLVSTGTSSISSGSWCSRSFICSKHTERIEAHMAQAQAAHATTGHDHPNYMAIFWILLVMTIAELATAAIPTGGAYPYPLKVALLVGMALGKAALVAAYFMHLRFERSTLGLIAVTPLVLCVFLLFMLLPDRLDRTHIHTPVAPPAAAPA